MVNGVLRVSVKTILSPNYALGDTLDDDTPDCDNGINDNNDNENYNYDNNENIDGNQFNDNNDDIMIMMIRQWWYCIQRFL